MEKSKLVFLAKGIFIPGTILKEVLGEYKKIKQKDKLERYGSNIIYAGGVELLKAGIYCGVGFGMVESFLK